MTKEINKIKIIAPRDISGTLNYNSEYCKIINVSFLKTNSEMCFEGYGLKITPIKLKHEGKQFHHVENFGYIINADQINILCVGDASMDKENFYEFPLMHKWIDLLVVPFPCIGIEKSRQIIKEYIKPKRIIAFRFPYEDKDEFNWIRGTKKYHEKKKLN